MRIVFFSRATTVLGRYFVGCFSSIVISSSVVIFIWGKLVWELCDVCIITVWRALRYMLQTMMASTAEGPCIEKKPQRIRVSMRTSITVLVWCSPNHFILLVVLHMVILCISILPRVIVSSQILCQGKPILLPACRSPSFDMWYYCLPLHSHCNAIPLLSMRQEGFPCFISHRTFCSTSTHHISVEELISSRCLTNLPF